MEQEHNKSTEELLKRVEKLEAFIKVAIPILKAMENKVFTLELATIAIANTTASNYNFDLLD